VLESYRSLQLADDERLAQLIGPARVMLARADLMTLTCQRSISRSLLGAVFCLCAALGMGALIPFAPFENRLVLGGAAALFAVAAGVLAYRIAMLRFDLAPLSAFTQELRAGLHTAEQAAAETAEEFEP
jgi:hypothetical protein